MFSFTRPSRFTATTASRFTFSSVSERASALAAKEGARLRARPDAGKEQFHPQWPDSEKWADCGGGVDAKDEDIIVTAAREAWEETMGCIHTYEELLERLRNNEAQAIFDIQTNENVGAYRIYLLRIPFADYNTTLNRFRAYLRRHKVHIMDSEKTALQWVSAADALAIARSCDDCKNTLLRPNFAKSILAMAGLIDFEKLE